MDHQHQKCALITDAGDDTPAGRFSPGEIELDLNRLLCPARTASDCGLAQLDSAQPEDAANNNSAAVTALTDSLRRRKKEE